MGRSPSSPKVDVVSGIGYDRAAALGGRSPRASTRSAASSRTSASSTSARSDHAMRLVSVHPGVSVDEVVEKTGFALVIEAPVAETRSPTPEELRLLRERLDPDGRRRARAAGLSDARRAPHRAVRPARVSLPDPPDGDGLGGDARAGGRGLERGRLRLPGCGDAAARGGRRRDREGEALTSQPFGVNFLMDAPGAELIVAAILRHGVRAAGYNRSPRADLIKRLKDAGVVCVPTCGNARHAAKAEQLGADLIIVQGGEGGGHTGNGADLAARLERGGSRRGSGGGGGRLPRRPRAGRGARVRGRRHRDGDALPAHPREPGSRSRRASATWRRRSTT